MCYDCMIIDRSGKALDVSGCGDLAAALGCDLAALPVWAECPPGGHRLEPDECLCWVDFEALGKQRGFSVKEPSGAVGDRFWDSWVMREIGG